MTRRGRWLCLLLVLQLALLSGCVQSIPGEKQPTAQTLPPVRSGHEAPIGDGQTEQEYSAVMHFPDDKGERMQTDVRRVVIEPNKTKHEAVVEALLKEISGNKGFNTSGQELRLATISNAVETTRDLVTVNMYTSMRFLPIEKQYALRLAIVNTLTEIPGTNYVNILVHGRDVGLDMAETVPSGIMDRRPSSDIAAQWRQVEAQRTSSESELVKQVALYFVTDDGQHMLGEVRNITFTEREPAHFALRILEEMQKGATYIAAARNLVPTQDWFERDPVAVTLEDGEYIALYFREEIDGYLSIRGSTRGMLLSSICYTLTSFIPRLDGIVAYVGGEMVTVLDMMDGEEWQMQNGQITRDSVAGGAADVCTVYFPLENGTGLYAVSRPIAQRMRTQPRALLRELMTPPTNPRLSGAIPEGITAADILGLQIQGDTALLNVTPAFAEACADLTPTQERNMIYAIVNTLTEMEGVTRVRFFVDGMQEPLAGSMFMQGEFMRHTGLIYAGPLE